MNEVNHFTSLVMALTSLTFGDDPEGSGALVSQRDRVRVRLRATWEVSPVEVEKDDVEQKSPRVDWAGGEVFGQYIYKFDMFLFPPFSNTLRLWPEVGSVKSAIGHSERVPLR